MKEIEKKDLQKKLEESEAILQERSKLAGFSSKLKNELYIKNIEIMSKFNNQQKENEELKRISKNNEKQLDENIKKLNDKREEVNKRELQAEEFMNKYEKEKKNANKIQKDMNNLLQKIYDTFQTGDKNLIIKGIRNIYNLYLSNDIKKDIDSSKLNINIRDELTKQIDFLQKGILSIADQKTKREMNQNSEIFKKMRENSALTIQLNQKEKDFTELNTELAKVKAKKADLDLKYNQLLKEYNNLKYKGRRMSATNFMNNTVLKNNIPKNFTDKNFMSATAKNGFGVGRSMGIPPIDGRKSWKDTKLYKGSTLSHFKESRGDAYKKIEIQKILDDKDEINKKKKLEILMLKAKIAERGSNYISKEDI